MFLNSGLKDIEDQYNVIVILNQVSNLKAIARQCVRVTSPYHFHLLANDTVVNALGADPFYCY